jgi:hypothetical protein
MYGLEINGQTGRKYSVFACLRIAGLACDQLPEGAEGRQKSLV